MSHAQQQHRQDMSNRLAYGQMPLSHDAPSRPPIFTAASSDSVEGAGENGQHRSVVRAACLNCRSAKRRCDGVAPVCGPCHNRGVEAGGCNFVSSKRGGPRYKGVKGAEAAKVKADKDRAKEAAKGSRTKKSEQDSNKSSYLTSDAGSTNSQQSPSPPASGNVSVTAGLTKGWRQSSASSQQSPGGGSNQSQSAYNSFAPNANGAQMAGHAQSFANPYNVPQESSQNYYPHSHSSQGQRLSGQSSQPQPFMLNNEQVTNVDGTFDYGPGGPLSFANLELWQRIQEGATNEDLAAFSDFYSRLEMLPKAGAVGAHDPPGVNTDPLDVLMDWEGGETGNNLQDNEQGARNLLTDFYEMVYPACPVLLPPGNLPSLAFYFSGKGPCGLFAAISSVVSLHLPQPEAVKTLKNSQAAMARFEGTSASSITTDKTMPVHEIAAYHAKTSELILHQYAEAKTTCFVDTTCPNPFAGMDEELITIEAAAAHTLLCHYYYGSGQPLSHQRAYKHAVEAWELAQTLNLRKSNWQDTDTVEGRHANSTRPFSSDLKLEWGKRVYWASYSAATVMSCTGGFQPFGNPKDEVLDLKLRPHLEHDVAAWGVMVRGAQQVSRTYRLLYDLDQLRAKLAMSGNTMAPNDLHQAAMERQTIFNAMLKLDSEIGTYTRFDPSWRNMPAGVEVSEGRRDYVEGLERQLANSLKLAGRLMTSGALIILHRAQAFSNARVFMQPQCGIPEAIRLHKPVKHDVILHRAVLEETGSHANTQEGAIVEGGVNHKQFGATSSTNKDSMYHRGPSVLNTASSAPNSSFSHPFLTDRFAGGPFEPTHSLERCRFAASAMISTLPILLREQSLPKLPPYSACSFVLGAYATLMLTLLIQVHAEESGQQHNVDIQQGYKSSSKTEELKRQLAIHRAPVKDILVVLNRFSKTWTKAVEYEEEVSTLLAANEIIG